MNTPLLPGESQIKQSRANLQRGAESVGGNLYLTTRRLVFESHRFNVQSGATAIDLSDVARLEKGWTKFLGVLPLAPNSIVAALLTAPNTESSARSATTGSPQSISSYLAKPAPLSPTQASEPATQPTRGPPIARRSA